MRMCLRPHLLSIIVRTVEVDGLFLVPLVVLLLLLQAMPNVHDAFIAVLI